MPVLSAHVLPHPPLIVPAVGRGRESVIRRTADSFRRVAASIAADAPETIIIISPHAISYSDYFHISGGSAALGSFARFGAENVHFKVTYDTELVARISAIAQEGNIPAGTDGDIDPDLDHGTTVPLYFIEQYLSDYKVVRISISGFDLERHFDYGVCIREAIGDKRVVVIASGDLSHRLTEDGPYGFNESGPKFDKQITEAMAAGDFDKFFNFDEELLENAAECGLRGFAIMSGILDRQPIETHFHSYEGPFGVGYSICSYKVLDMHVYLARVSLKHYLETGEYIKCPELPENMTVSGHGVFVSIKKHGNLRGCIGTISGVQENLALEIIVNAVSAGVRDPRFEAITLDELDDLEFSVDVLFSPEPADISKLDVKRYGVIVSAGYRRGLLLPNLEGVDTVAMQLAIALQKAGISTEESFNIERFEVVRYR